MVVSTSELTSSSPDLDLVALGLLGIRPRRISAWLVDAGSGGTCECRFSSWKRCRGLYLRPSSSTGGNSWFGSSDRCLMHNHVAPLLEGAILLSRGVTGVGFGDVWHFASIGLAGLAVVFLLFGLSIPCFSAPGTMSTPV